jgi:quercetin dioxygenase-like cupin family protein
MKVVKISEALRRLKSINKEIRYTPVAEGRSFSAGVISFTPAKGSDPKQINHPDRDVLCHVIEGRGRLRVNGRKIALESGTLCHIPKGTPHDFAAGRSGKLILFYALINSTD